METRKTETQNKREEFQERIDISLITPEQTK